MRALRSCLLGFLLAVGTAGRSAPTPPAPPAPLPSDAPGVGSACVLVSVPDQLLALVENRTASIYPISTSKFGIGDEWGSYKTPLGRFRVCDKLGAKLPPGAVIKNRSATGEVLRPNAPGRDPIVTRILWLEGLEPGNSRARERAIYIHGTPEEATLGTPVSWGCVRMRSVDVVNLFEHCDLGSAVTIANLPLGALLQREFGNGLAECPALPGFAARVSVPITYNRPFLTTAPDPSPRPWLRLTLASGKSLLEPDFTDLRYSGMLQLTRPNAQMLRAMRLESALRGRISLQ